MDICHHYPLVGAIIEQLQKELPPVFARRDIPKFFGTSLPVGTIANMGSAGPPYIRRGRHAIYEKGKFLSWYENWLNQETTLVNS